MARRLQIWLTEAQYAVLNDEANRTSVSMAEQLRRLVDREYRPTELPPRNGLGVRVTVSRRPDVPFVGRRPGIRLVDRD